jgi:hypothetical protein
MRVIQRFQARGIQDMLGIPKHRYEYIASKIGVRPDVEQGEGRGTAHVYSFRNTLQFAFVHFANLQGLSPATCRDMITLLNFLNDNHGTELHKTVFGDWVGINLYLYSAKIGNRDYFALSHVMGEVDQSHAVDERASSKSVMCFITSARDEINRIVTTKAAEDGSFDILERGGIGKVTKVREDWLSSCETYSAVNLGLIKEKVMEHSLSPEELA